MCLSWLCVRLLCGYVCAHRWWDVSKTHEASARLIAPPPPHHHHHIEDRAASTGAAPSSAEDTITESAGIASCIGGWRMSALWCGVVLLLLHPSPKLRPRRSASLAHTCHRGACLSRHASLSRPPPSSLCRCTVACDLGRAPTPAEGRRSMPQRIGVPTKRQTITHIAPPFASLIFPPRAQLWVGRERLHPALVSMRALASPWQCYESWCSLHSRG